MLFVEVGRVTRRSGRGRNSNDREKISVSSFPQKKKKGKNRVGTRDLSGAAKGWEKNAAREKCAKTRISGGNLARGPRTEELNLLLWYEGGETRSIEEKIRAEPGAEKATKEGEKKRPAATNQQITNFEFMKLHFALESVRKKGNTKREIKERQKGKNEDDCSQTQVGSVYGLSWSKRKGLQLQRRERQRKRNGLIKEEEEKGKEERFEKESGPIPGKNPQYGRRGKKKNGNWE